MSKISIPRNKIKSRIIHNTKYYYFTYYWNKQQKTFYGKTQQEVKEKFSKWLEQEEQPIEVTDTFENHFYGFICNKKNSWKPKTLESYMNTYKHIKASSLSKIKMNGLRESDISSFLSGLKFSFQSKKLILTHIRTCLNYWLKLGVINRNVANMIELRDFTIKESKDRYIPKDVIDKLLQDVEGTNKELVVKLMYYMGLRLGEAMAISNKDLKGNILTINKSISNVSIDGKYTTIISTPKNQSSIRTILVPDHLVPLIQSADKPFSLNRNTLQLFLRDKYHISPHDLRHTFISNAVMNGVPIEVLREYVGHAKNSTTLESYYLHLSNDYKNNVMNEFFNK